MLLDVSRLGKQGGVPVRALTATNNHSETEIYRAAFRGQYDEVVLGTSLPPGDTKFLSSRSLSLVQKPPSPVLPIVR